MADNYVHELFEQLHAMPELGFEELRTSAFLAGELEKAGFKVTRNVGGKTGVIGVLDSGKPGLRIAMRGDMDALPYIVDGKGVAIHACGHDAHSSMVMAAAKQLAEKGIERGALVVIFQPAEETSGGAESIAKSGLIDDVDEIVGIHIRPVADFKVGFATSALYHSAMAQPKAKICGVTAHGAMPHLGVNAVDAAALAVNAVNAVKGKPTVIHSVKTTKVVSVGNADNTIPNEVRMVVDIRCHENDEIERLVAKVEKAISAAADAVGATVEFEPVAFSYAPTYDDGMKETACEAIREVLGEKGCIPDHHITGSEDFHDYPRILGCKTIYVGVGAEATPGLHHPDMTFDHKALDYGRDILRKIVEKRFEKAQS